MKLEKIIFFVYSLLSLQFCWLFHREGDIIISGAIVLLLGIYLVIWLIKKNDSKLIKLLYDPLALNIDWYLILVTAIHLGALLFMTEGFNPHNLFLLRLIVMSLLAVNAMDIFYDVKYLKTFLIDINQKLEEKLIEINNFQIISKALNTILDLERLLNMILDIATNLLKVEIVTLFLIDRESNTLQPKVYRGMTEEVAKNLVINVGEESIIGYVAEKGENLLIRDIEKDERFSKRQGKSKKYKTKSLVCVPLKIRDEVIGVLSINNKMNEMPFNEADLEMATVMASQAAIAIENANLYKDMEKSYISTVRALSAAIDAKDKYTSGHSSAVTEYVLLIAQEMDLSVNELSKLEYAGLLHDIGKIGIMEQILNKPGRLTGEEFEIIKKHPVIGYEILKSIDFLKEVTLLVKHHHERYDGKGYPDGLKGEDIPLGARIIAVADTFDAMTSDRPYRKGLPLEIALAEIKKCSGTQFDPVIVEAFFAAYEKGRIKLFTEGRHLAELVDVPG